MDDNSIGYNLLIVGQKGVGKFSLHYRFAHDLFPSVYDPFFDDGSEQNIKECFWTHKEGRRSTVFRVRPRREEIARPGEYQPIPDHHDVNGMILVYRINSATSYEAVKEYVEARKRENGGVLHPKPLALVGNMMDCKRKERKVLGIEAEELAAKIGCVFVECSAKDGKYIENVKKVAMAKMATQKDELISLELGLIKPRPKPQVIVGSDKPARESFERRNSFVGRLSALRASKQPKKKVSNTSLGSMASTITPIPENSRWSEDSASSTGSADGRTATLATIKEGEKADHTSDAGSERSSSSSSPPSPHSDSSEFSNFSSVSSAPTSVDNALDDDRSIYTVWEEEPPFKTEKPLPAVPKTYAISPPKVLHETPIESLDALLASGGKLENHTRQHKRVDSMDPVTTEEPELNARTETPKSPIPTEASPNVEHHTTPPHIASVALREQEAQAPTQLEIPAMTPPPLNTHPAMKSATTPAPLPPPRSPWRGMSRPGSIIENHPAMPSRQSSTRSTRTVLGNTSGNNIGVVLPPLSPHAAAKARQNILLQIAALMQSQAEIDQLQQEAAAVDMDPSPAGSGDEDGSGSDISAEDDALKLEEEITALKERLRLAEERKKLLASPRLGDGEGFSSDQRLGPILAAGIRV